MRIRRRGSIAATGYALGVACRHIIGVASAPYRAFKRKRHSARPERKKSLAAVSSALADKRLPIREAGARALGDLASEDVEILLDDTLHDPEPTVRIHAARSAAKSSATGSVFTLILLLDDPVAQVRATAKSALEELCGRSVDIDINGEAADRKAAIQALKRWWTERRAEQLAGGGKLV